MSESSVEAAAAWLGVDAGVWAAVLALAGAIAVFVAGEYVRARRDRLERRRAVLESWLRAVAEWVTEFRRSGSDSDEALADVVNADVLVLSLSRRDSIVAYWMHEMLLELRDSVNLETGLPAEMVHQAKLSRATAVSSEIGGALTGWHAGRTAASDFWVPYKIRNYTRGNELNMYDFAEGLHLRPFLSPFRYRIRDRVAMLILTATKDTWWLFWPTFGPIARDIATLMQMRFPSAGWMRVLDTRRPTWHLKMEDDSRRWVRESLSKPGGALVSWIWRENQIWPPGANAGV
jgi:hypothetical protein